uniref:Uncharacterized protein n=1 Tax=Arundo donax TaxID=35708 RepID=A0A0A9E2X3_ARUDO
MMRGEATAPWWAIWWTSATPPRRRGCRSRRCSYWTPRTRCSRRWCRCSGKTWRRSRRHHPRRAPSRTRAPRRAGRRRTCPQPPRPGTRAGHPPDQRSHRQRRNSSSTGMRQRRRRRRTGAVQSTRQGRPRPCRTEHIQPDERSSHQHDGRRRPSQR